MQFAVLLILLSADPDPYFPPLFGPDGSQGTVAAQPIRVANTSARIESLAQAPDYSGSSTPYFPQNNLPSGNSQFSRSLPPLENVPPVPMPLSEPSGPVSPEPLPAESYSEGYGQEGAYCGAAGCGGGGCSSGGCCGSRCGIRRGCCGIGGCGLLHGCFAWRHDPLVKARCHALWSCDPGDMHPWVPCWAQCNANYYFRPYYWKHVGIQQQIAARWGADPRAPYQSNVMKEVYAELGISEPGLDYEEIPSPGQLKTKPSDYFESVDCKRW